MTHGRVTDNLVRVGLNYRWGGGLLSHRRYGLDWSHAGLLPGARLREGAIVGAAAVVDLEVPPFVVVAGNPGRAVGSAHARASFERV
jgi:hypothetical protein